MKRFIWVLAAAAVLISSCMKEEIDAGKVEVIIRAEGMSSKSSLDVDENKIVDLNVYAYCGGVLYFDGYSQDESVKLLLDGKREYTIYLLANFGKVAPTYKESEMDSMKCDFVYKREGALPMCLSEGRKIRVGGTATMTYTFSLTRLVSKYTVSLKDLLEECRFEARSARILQEASCVYPFAYGSAAHSVVDGDSASETDIAALNRGECVDFYVLENCQGLLLEGNDDPWKKFEEEYPIGSIMTGKVVSITKFGAFVNILPGIDGLVHISEISNERVDDPNKVLKVGQEVKVKLKDVDLEAKRVSLSIKRTLEAPKEETEE